MKSLVFTAVLLASSSNAFAISSTQVKKAYDGCVKFLAMPGTQQAQIAAKSGYSLQQDVWGCQYMVRHGLQSDIEREHEYQNALQELKNSGAQGVGITIEAPQTCQANTDCGVSLYQCVGQRCAEVGSPGGGCDNGAHECQPGVQCVSGVCQGP